MRKACDLLLCLLFFAVIAGVAAATWLLPKKDTSFLEGRTLSPAPAYADGALVSGEYWREWEAYYTDHIALRDEMLAAYTAFRVYAAGQPVVNDIVIAGGVLLPLNKPLAVNEEIVSRKADQMGEKLQTIRAAAEENGGIFLYVGVPEQGSMLRDRYPPYLNNNADYLDLAERVFYQSLDRHGVEYINMREVFSEKPDPLYYYSAVDHHFNIFGAYECYREILTRVRERGYSVRLPEREDWTLIELPNRFYGSRGRMLYKLYGNAEKLRYYEPREPIAYVRYDAEVRVDRILFLPASPEEDVTYSVYMGGDSAQTCIDTFREELPTVLMFGDSFTNPVETLLYASFGKSIFIDLRHYRESTIYECIERYRPDVVICLRDDTQYLSFDGNGGF